MPFPSRIRIAALAVGLAGLVSACGGGGGAPDPVADGSQAPDASAGADSETPPDLVADKDPAANCDNSLGTGDVAFEAAFCAYREAALAATSGAEGVTGVDASLLSAGDEAIAQFETDPAAALATLEAATAALS